jgi:NagD protein
MENPVANFSLNLETSYTTVIGDNMDTDIQGGAQMGHRTTTVI